jgi:CBS domain-containing protein
VDPLEILFVRDAMRTNLVALPSDGTPEQIRKTMSTHHGPRGQYLYPVVDGAAQLRGVITRKHLQKLMADPHSHGDTLGDVASQVVVVAYPDEPLRVVVYRMAETGLTRFPVVDRGDERKLLGIIGLRDLLSARTRNLEEERNRERVLRVRLPLRGKVAEAAPPGSL